jgi:hypothetical protein
MSETYDFEVEFIERELIDVTLTTIDVAPGSTGGASTLAELNDVALTNLLNQQYLRYNATLQKWENVTLGTIIGENSVYNEIPTKISSTQFQTANDYVAGTLRVYFNGIKEKNITEDSNNLFSLPIAVNLDDEIEVNYIQD